MEQINQYDIVFWLILTLRRIVKRMGTLTNKEIEIEKVKSIIRETFVD
jgi:hypothetical protein